MIHVFGGVTSTSLEQTKDTYYGVEYEVENIYEVSLPVGDCFNITEDGSLRNNGKEFISRPSTYENTLQQNQFLFESLVLGDKAFSDRTSIHVHVNCGNLTAKQVMNVIYLYIISEPLWFAKVKPERKNNIFCVPLYTTCLQRMYNRGIKYMVQHWHKYTAFNILPLQYQGTIEFRHHHGTGDYVEFKNWLTCINELFNVAERRDMSITTILENPEKILRQYLPTLVNTHTSFELQQMIAPTVLDLKLAMIE